MLFTYRFGVRPPFESVSMQRGNLLGAHGLEWGDDAGWGVLAPMANLKAVVECNVRNALQLGVIQSGWTLR
jgi:hypothetical protein